MSFALWETNLTHRNGHFASPAQGVLTAFYLPGAVPVFVVLVTILGYTSIHLSTEGIGAEIVTVAAGVKRVQVKGDGVVLIHVPIAAVNFGVDIGTFRVETAEGGIKVFAVKGYGYLCPGAGKLPGRRPKLDEISLPVGPLPAGIIQDTVNNRRLFDPGGLDRAKRSQFFLCFCPAEKKTDQSTNQQEFDKYSAISCFITSKSQPQAIVIQLYAYWQVIVLRLRGVYIATRLAR